LLKTNVNERFSQQEIIIIIKLFLSIIFNGFPVLSFAICIVQIFRSPEKRCIEVSLYMVPMESSMNCVTEMFDSSFQDDVL
jgi:hypothetical protein